MYLIISLLLLLASQLPGTNAKCSLTPIEADDRTIAYVCLHGDLKDLDDVPNEAEWIEFTVARFDVIPASAFVRFKQLRKLTFFNCKLNELNADAFRGLNQLEMLVMFNTKMGVARAAVFQHMPNLKILKLEGTGLMYIEPEVFEILSKRLEELSIRNNDVDCLPVEALAKIERLKIMKIDDNPWLCDCKSSLLEFFRGRNIQQMSNNDFTHHRRKRGQYRWSSEQSFETSSSHYVYDCMAVLKYPPLPPSNVTDTSYYSRYNIERREQKITSVHSLDHLPDNIGWLEIFDVHIPRLQRYMFFRFGNTLRSIILRNCGIDTIDLEAFAGLHKLERLVIIGARLPIIGSCWFRDLGRLSELVLENSNVEKFEYGALDHLTSLRRLDLKENRLNCLPEDAIRGLGNLERLDARGNPWLCSCRQDLENNLLRRRIGYDISNGGNNGGGCLQGKEVTRPHDYNEYYNHTSTGWIRWSWGYETHQSRPTRPPPTTPRPPPVIQTPRPPIRRNGCKSVPAGLYFDRDYYNNLRGHTYLCEDATLVDLRQIPSITETIIFTKSIIQILRSDEFRKFDGFLKRLEFRDCAIQEIEDRAFAGIKNLQVLVLHGNNIKVVRSEWFTDTQNLQRLTLAHNNIHEIETRVFEMVPFLITLDISENKINCLATERLKNLRYITDLHLADNPWTCLCAEALHRFVNSRNIFCADACLDVVLRDRCHNTAFTPRPSTPVSSSTPSTSVYPPPTRIYPPPTSVYPPPTSVYPPPTSVYPPPTSVYPPPTIIYPPPTSIRPLPPLPPLPDLTTNISGSCYSDHDGKHYHCSNGDRFILDHIPSWVSVIDLYDCYIEHLPASAFSRFENLTELVLRNCSLREVDERAFYGLRRLERLTIKGNNFAVVREGWFTHCDNLYRLDLSNNYLVEIESRAFHNLKRLQYLNLEDNMFSCIYTNSFIQLPQLDTVEFSRNPLKWRCWQELKQFLEVRAIGYTDHKCPYDTTHLVRNLQKEGSSQSQSYTDGATENDVTYFGFILTAAMVYSFR
ncbi:slit homolog 2 protein-like [Diachasmimorpha longicaudata]|uniref:slit homolog 2 protein-like n=1 Tax=Diachasmimorpha longicaudata TaxID=58733 RepID=UPI0030B90A8E